MRYYETMIIVHPALEANRLKDIILGVQENLGRKGGEVRSINIWGRKRLAYKVDKQKYGTYVLMQYAGESIRANDFNVDLEHDANILAYQTLRIEEEQIQKQEQDLDTQIAGTIKDSAYVEEPVKVEPKKAAEPAKAETEENAESAENAVDEAAGEPEEAEDGEEQSESEGAAAEETAEAPAEEAEKTLEDKEKPAEEK